MADLLLTTELSFLSKRPLPDPSVLDQCVLDCKDLLLVKPPIFIFGKECHQQRDIGFFSNTSKGYQYSGQMAPSQPLSDSLKTLLETVNELYGAEFNGILVNRYTSGADYISAHSDDETKLDKIGVVSVSHGATRTFRIRDKKSKKIMVDVPMVPGQLLHMGGLFQREFTHEIPPEKRVNEVRFSFTFRRHLE
jgi:alkylated DNA repair dioxygenase AlkB